MEKAKISKDEYKIIIKYKKLTKELAELKKKRKTIFEEIFDNISDNTVALTVKGEKMILSVEKQISSSVSWKGLAENNIAERVIQDQLPDYTNPYEKFLVKI